MPNDFAKGRKKSNEQKNINKRFMPWQKWGVSSHMTQMQYCDCRNAKEKSTWRVLSYMSPLNHCPFLSSIYKFVVYFPTCYWQLFTCRFKFTFKWHFHPLVQMINRFSCPHLKNSHLTWGALIAWWIHWYWVVVSDLLVEGQGNAWRLRTYKNERFLKSELSNRHNRATTLPNPHLNYQC